MKTTLQIGLFFSLFFTSASMIASATEYRLSPSDDWFSIITGNNLQPGDEVILSQGIYSSGRRLSISHRGSAQAPIIIRSKIGDIATITRPNANQNTINIEGAQHIILRGLEITGGSVGIRIGSKFFNGTRRQAEFITLEECHIHHTAEAAVTANFSGDINTGHKFLRNEIHHTGGTGEGFYLGANNNRAGNTAAVFRDGLIEGNYIHHLNDPSISQGDGIEIKDGSYNNIIRGNVIHDTNYPGILVYGTDGHAPNIIEGNVIWSSGDNSIQAASEAVIFNNIIFDSAKSGIQSQNHQSAVPGSLTIVHNTIISNGNSRAISVGNPAAGSLSGPIVIANNAIYSTGSGLSLFLPNIPGFTISGNIGVGNVRPAQTISAWNPAGNPNIDFNNVDDKGVYPIEGSLLIGNADTNHTIKQDFNGTERIRSLDVGAYAYTSKQNPGWKIDSQFKGLLTSPNASKLVLPNNQWKQIGLPFSPPDKKNTIAEIFGDDINGEYGTDWVLYSYNPINNKYFSPRLNDVIKQGIGYWIIQLNGSEVVVDLPKDSTLPALTLSSQCSSATGCFEIALGTRQNDYQRLVLGHPFPRDIVWNNLRITTSSEECADADGCTLSEAEDLSIIYSHALRFNPKTSIYNIIQNESQLRGWDGFWVTTLDMAYGLNPKLLIPARSLSENRSLHLRQDSGAL